MIKIFKHLIQAVGLPITSFTVPGDIKKKPKKKSSENDQLTGHFQSLFIYLFFFTPPTLNLKKFPVNQLIKKFWPKVGALKRLPI